MADTHINISMGGGGNIDATLKQLAKALRDLEKIQQKRPRVNLPYPWDGREEEVLESPWPVLGWRDYKVSTGGSNKRWWLGGMRETWVHPWMESECPHYSSTHYGNPGWDCSCGVYAVKLRRRDQVNYGWEVLALVAMENVVEHKLGYRAGRTWVLAATASNGHQFVEPAIRMAWPQVRVVENEEVLAEIGLELETNPHRIPGWPAGSVRGQYRDAEGR